ncbi:reverse transcriptase family protein [Photobacterium leiognathi]|uniref:reverse transcriptase family protein n=1 Tax=Photobacterium leiognathi TaxID=553611 RepID=UPI002982A888|nr:reverse transcriptase family protein [Photobacterium leiognathi]
MDKPLYPCKSIGSIQVLAQTLGVHPKKLTSLARKANSSYTSYELPPHPTTQKIRVVVEPKHELKKLQKRINSRIFVNVKFPNYLQGGLKATSTVKRDYIANAFLHGKSKTLINLDVKNFYPNIKQKNVVDIFKYFFKFSDEVVDILTALTTYNGSLPQGGCTSSYLANLVFFNEEYKLVSSFRGQKLRYTRLLDDITISSEKTIIDKDKEKIIKRVAAMLKKHGLSLKSSKTKVTDRSEMHKDFEVTGLCVRAATPKASRKDRRYVRQLVHNCELMAIGEKTSDDYHALWNKTSGLVARLTQLKHSEAEKYRVRLSKILPEYDQYQKDKVIKRARAALKVPFNTHSEWGTIRRYNRIIYHLGILARTDKKQANDMKSKLQKHYSSRPTINEYWES